MEQDKILSLNKETFFPVKKNDCGGYDMQYPKFVRMNLDGANFDHFNIKTGLFSFGLLNQASFYEAKLDNCDFSLANLVGANFDSSDLRFSDLNGADCSNASFIDANLDKTELRNAIFTGATYTKRTVFPNNFDPKDHGMILVEVSK